MFKRRTGRKRTRVSTLSHLFHGIAIEPGDQACEAARRMSEQRFLSEEAPILPLEACTCVDACRCVYRHYSDRRTEVRREADLGLPERHIPEEKRASAGRRVTDA